MSDVIEVIEDVVNVSIDETHIEVVSVGTQGPPGPTGDPATNLVTSVNGHQGDVTGLAELTDLESYATTVALGALSAAVSTALNGKVDKVGTTNRAYVTDGSGNQTTYPVSQGALGDSIARRDGGGRLSASDASTATQLATKGQMDVALATKMSLAGDETITGRKTFNLLPIFTADPVASNHGARKAYVDALTPYFGVGFPNGVLSAPVGSIYIDTAVTNGASSWIKKSGSGNTGWSVLEGNTGWRNVTHLLLNGWAGFFTNSVLILRDGNNTYIKLDGIKAASATANTFMNMPSGFRTSGANSRFALHSLGAQPSSMYRGYFTSGGDGLVTAVTSSFGDLFGELSYATTEAWPTTLPGTAA